MMRASVRLTGMGIDWEEEMKRAEEEEKERAAENQLTFTSYLR